MKEKTKQILRYVACGLGGLALGIGLLGGLSMCASSGNKQTEEVNTIYERTRKNALTSTENGGYDKYEFYVLNWLNGQTMNTYDYRVFDVNYSTYTLTLAESTMNNTMTTGYESIPSVINSVYEASRPSTRGSLRFLVIEGRTNVPQASASDWYWGYFTFLTYSNPSMEQMPFYLLNNVFTERVSLESWTYPAEINPNLPIILNSDKSGSFLVSRGTSPASGYNYHFQDMVSYLKEEGYNAGYNAGYDDGETAGYSEGHTAGYSEGHTAGYSEGYDDAYAEKDSGIAFTSCGVYPNAHVTLQTDETIGNFNYMYLCHYITKPGYDEHTIYIMWTQNANTHQYLGEVIDRNDSDSYDPAVTLGSFSQEVTPSVTITANEDMEFGLWVGYITTFHNRGEITNSILWFQGGTSESDMQIYQNGYDEGYQNGNQAGQETGYDQGYDRGHEVGDAEGYSRGYTEGFNQTNTKNVFSLFTSAFDSVASFFDLKIFGFLPLYWFFLAPLFIALISLLMRMVKH